MSKYNKYTVELFTSIEEDEEHPSLDKMAKHINVAFDRLRDNIKMNYHLIFINTVNVASNQDLPEE